MDGQELYAMLVDELDTEGIQAKPWEVLPSRAQIAWAKLARRLTREAQPRQPMLSEYPD